MCRCLTVMTRIATINRPTPYTMLCICNLIWMLKSGIIQYGDVVRNLIIITYKSWRNCQLLRWVPTPLRPRFDGSSDQVAEITTGPTLYSYRPMVSQQTSATSWVCGQKFQQFLRRPRRFLSFECRVENGLNWPLLALYLTFFYRMV